MASGNMAPRVEVTLRTDNLDMFPSDEWLLDLEVD